jgi:hypothetical protein
VWHRPALQRTHACVIPFWPQAGDAIDRSCRTYDLPPGCWTPVAQVQSRSHTSIHNVVSGRVVTSISPVVLRGALRTHVRDGSLPQGMRAEIIGRQLVDLVWYVQLARLFFRHAFGN